jgi:hypothetical protein
VDQFEAATLFRMKMKETTRIFPALSISKPA